MKNTEIEIQAVDALALLFSLQRQTNVESASFIDADGFGLEPYLFPYFKDDWDNIKYVEFVMSRLTFDEGGGITGEESFVGRIPVYHKREFNIKNIAWAISPLVVFPSQLDHFTEEDKDYSDIEFEYHELAHALSLAIIEMDEFVQGPQERTYYLGDEFFEIDKIVKASVD